jgi:hypothetical protein
MLSLPEAYGMRRLFFADEALSPRTLEGLSARLVEDGPTAGSWRPEAADTWRFQAAPAGSVPFFSILRSIRPEHMPHGHTLQAGSRDHSVAKMLVERYICRGLGIQRHADGGPMGLRQRVDLVQ